MSATDPVLEPTRWLTQVAAESLRPLIDGLEAQAKHEGAPARREYSTHVFGTRFAEVGVDARSGEVRERRMLGVLASGRILNPRPRARS